MKKLVKHKINRKFCKRLSELLVQYDKKEPGLIDFEYIISEEFGLPVYSFEDTYELNLDKTISFIEQYPLILQVQANNRFDWYIFAKKDIEKDIIKRVEELWKECNISAKSKCKTCGGS